MVEKGQGGRSVKNQGACSHLERAAHVQGLQALPYARHLLQVQAAGLFQLNPVTEPPSRLKVSLRNMLCALNEARVHLLVSLTPDACPCRSFDLWLKRNHPRHGAHRHMG